VSEIIAGGFMLEIDQKINTYQVALNNVIKQLRDKRSELADLARKTVAEIDASIPKLQKKVDELRAESQKLDAAILQKQEQYRLEKISFLAEYEAMRTALQNEHDAKLRDLSKARKDAEELNKILSAKIKDADTKLSELNSSIESVNAEKSNNQKIAEAFRAERIKALDDIEKSKAAVAKSAKDNQELGEALKAEIAKVKEQTKSLSDKISEANKVIASIKKANEILTKAEAMEAESKKREEKNNTDAVNNLAEKKRLSLRSDAQDRRDEALQVREENIKIIEKELSK
jgi:chromosome segregation ATPase